MIPAQIREILDQLGSIEAGKIADIIAVVGNPVVEIKMREKVIFVMKEGEAHKMPE